MRSVLAPFTSAILLLILAAAAGAQDKAPALPPPILPPVTPGPGSSRQEAERPESKRPPAEEKQGDLEARLYLAIIERLGIPYLEGGTDNGGYDCSGLIWRVFTTAGVELKRTSARIMWEELPQASPDERDEFGTLVFFNDLNHVGIVRDSWSFYHASTSQGVTRSFFTDYWIERIIGYRRIPLKPAGRGEETGRPDQATPRPPNEPHLEVRLRMFTMNGR